MPVDTDEVGLRDHPNNATAAVASVMNSSLLSPANPTFAPSKMD